MIKAPKRLFTLTSCFILSLFFLIPQNDVYAFFSDVASEGSGIHLTLGTIDLSVGNDLYQSNPITANKQDDTLKIEQVIQNKGTVTGKVAYKIHLENTDGKELNPSLLKSIKIEVDNQEVVPNDKYQFFTGESDDYLYLEPNEQSEKIYLKFELPDVKRNEIIQVQIYYLMMQTNGTIENPLLCEEEISTHLIEIEAKEDLEIKNSEPALSTSESQETQGKGQEAQNVLLENVSAGNKESESKLTPPLDEDFLYFDISLNVGVKNIGITQEQFDWITSFKSIEDFISYLDESEAATLLYLKYDKLVEVENIQQFVYEIIETEKLEFNLELKDIPERKMLEIKFVK